MTAVDLHERDIVRRSLSEWAERQGASARDLERLYRGIDGNEDPQPELQDCFYRFPGLTAQPWHDPAEYRWTAALNQAYPDIKKEFLTQYEAGLSVHPESAALAAAGAWDTYHFYRMAEHFSTNLAACPATAAALAHVPGIANAGMAYFSAMQADTEVKPHCGFVNARIRCHLGLVVPEDCWIRVGNETRSWVEGECIVFDDSFEHEVRIGSVGWRAVLLLDTWHPDLTSVEIAGLTHLMHTWRELFS